MMMMVMKTKTMTPKPTPSMWIWKEFCTEPELYLAWGTITKDKALQAASKKKLLNRRQHHRMEYQKMLKMVFPSLPETVAIPITAGLWRYPMQLLKGGPATATLACSTRMHRRHLHNSSARSLDWLRLLWFASGILLTLTVSESHNTASRGSKPVLESVELTVRAWGCSWGCWLRAFD